MLWNLPGARPSAINSPSDVFRMALRDLRASNSLIRLAQGTGEVADLEQLGTWADDLTKRLNTVQEATGKKRTPPARRAAVTEGSEPKQLAPAKKTKKDTTPKNKPADVDVAFAKAVAEEYNDDQVRGWAKDFASGKISEQQWISRLTTHAASTKDTLDDIFDRAGQRLAKEQNANSGPTET